MYKTTHKNNTNVPTVPQIARKKHHKCPNVPGLNRTHPLHVSDRIQTEAKTSQMSQCPRPHRTHASALFSIGIQTTIKNITNVPKSPILQNPSRQVYAISIRLPLPLD